MEARTKTVEEEEDVEAEAVEEEAEAATIVPAVAEEDAEITTTR